MGKENLDLLKRKIVSLKEEGKYKEIIETCYLLLELGTELNDHKSILTAHINHATSYYCIGNIEEAFSSIEAHEDLSSKYGDDEDRLNSYNILFLLYEYNKDIDKAKATLEKAIQLGKKLKKFNIVSNGYSNYSHICILEEKYIDALENATVGLTMAKLHEPATPILELRVKLNLANAHIQLGNFDTSKALIDEMIQDPILASFTREKSQCYDLQGRWYMNQKLYREAFKSLSYAKRLVESYNDVNLLRGIQEQRSELCELMNDIRLGYIVQKEYIALLHEISNREIALTALKLNVKHRISSIEKKANTDYLSGLYNRRYMETTINKWLNKALATKESIICIAFDLDNFKAINDEYGHIFGDEAIKQVSKACSNIIRETDLIGRFGGDEFAIILKGVSLANGVKKANQLLDVIRAIKIEKDGKLVEITASIGVADNGEYSILDFNTLFNFADIKLYEAKQKGKNQICVLK